MLNSRSRPRRFRKTNGARSLSHSTRQGSPRLSLEATSASSCAYAASTDCSGVSSAGRSFSERMVLIRWDPQWDTWDAWDPCVPPAVLRPLDFDLDGERPRLRVLRH